MPPPLVPPPLMPPPRMPPRIDPTPMRPSTTTPGGGPDGPRSTTSSSLPFFLRFVGVVSTRLGDGGVGSTFLRSGCTGAVLHGQVGPSATVVGANTVRLMTRTCNLRAVA